MEIPTTDIRVLRERWERIKENLMGETSRGKGKDEEAAAVAALVAALIGRAQLELSRLRRTRASAQHRRDIDRVYNMLDEASQIMFEVVWGLYGDGTVDLISSLENRIRLPRVKL